MAALLVAVILYAANEHNQIYRSVIARQLGALIEDAEGGAGRIAVDYGWWDEAYQHLAVARDARWGDENIGLWLSRTAGMARATAIGAEEVVLYSWPVGEPAGLAAVAPLVAAARAAQGGNIRFVTSYLVSDGHVYLAAASSLRPVAERLPVDSVLVLWWDVEEHLIPRLQRLSGIASLSLGGDGAPLAEFFDTAGAAVGSLNWDPARPGDRFVFLVMPIAGAAFALMVATLWLMWLRARSDWARAQSLEESRKRLLAAVGHDLRQPLQSLSLFCAALDPWLQEDRPRRILANLGTSVERMGAMLNAILTLARLDLSDSKPMKGPVPLGPLLLAVAEEMRPQAEAKQLDLRVAPTTLWADTCEPLLATVVRNLVANAIRYTHGGGVLMGCRIRGPAVELWVCDTGIGISNDQCGLVFEEFFQVGNPERDASKGTGLGLAIVGRICKALGHRVGLRSVAGRGSIFSISMPRRPPVAQAGMNHPHPRAGDKFSRRPLPRG